jgi:hypothetical protein
MRVMGMFLVGVGGGIAIADLWTSHWAGFLSVVLFVIGCALVRPWRKEDWTC